MRLGRELAGDGDAVGRLEVERDRALAAGVVLEAAAHAAMAGVGGVPAGIAFRRLDLDHLGAEVGQQHSTVGTGQDLAEVDNAYA